MKWIFWLVLLAAGILWEPANAARLKDLASIRGVRNNQLVGYGLVVGLAGTGDKASELTEHSLGLAVKGLGVDLKSQKVEARNTAAVICTAILPPFARQGSRLDVTVSSIGSATSLDGGMLILTSLRGPDGNVYAMAQGKILATIRRGEVNNRPTGQTLVTASVPQGALLEREVPFDFTAQHELKYQLFVPDFTTAARIARTINDETGGKYATAEDAGTVNVIVPYNFDGTPADFVARIESLDVEPDRVAKVVINQRTGTVVLGEQVKIAPVAIAHGNLRVTVREANAGGEASAKKTLNAMKGANIAEIAASLNEMGASPDDLVALLQALKASGALTAELEVQ